MGILGFASIHLDTLKRLGIWDTGETGEAGKRGKRGKGGMKMRACLGAGAELVALELQVEAATRQAEFARGAGDVAAMFTQSL